MSFWLLSHLGLWADGAPRQ